MTVRVGLDSLVQPLPAFLRHARVGLVTNAAAVTRGLENAFEALRRVGLSIVALFTPEHGFFASADAGAPVDHGRDPHTGVPVYSLYGETWAPTEPMLEGVTHLLVDLPTVGARFFTYESTLVHVLRAGAHFSLPVVVLDRPNPITGRYVEGPLLREEYRSFVGLLPLPVRHGLTPGELAGFANRVLNIGAELSVIPLDGWKRSMWFDETGWPWVPPSPNIPSLDTATLYPGTCLVEGTTLSEGRGTPLPFQVVGAPGLDGQVLADVLNRADLAGVRFRPVQFTPCASKHRGRLCSGVQVHVIDRDEFWPVRTALALLAAVRDLAPDVLDFLPPREGNLHPFDRVVGNSSTRAALKGGAPWQEIVQGWDAEEQAFETERRAWLMYA